MIEQTLEFDREERECFRSGQLREEWAQRYRQLFDADDLRIARTQPDYHFFEWLAAVHFLESRGYLSLVEQYQFPSHQRKRLVLSRLVPPELVESIEHSSIQPPDLLVYAPDYSDWFFCEVKGPNDKITPRQETFFLQLEARSGKQICLLRLVAVHRVKAP
jgi:hypothetical protein